MDRERLSSSKNLVDTRAWPHVDLYEFIRPAFSAMRHFIDDPSFSNPELLVVVLNSQAHFMDCFNDIVRHTLHGPFVPEDIHRFRQWHHEMFKALGHKHRSKVIGKGLWVVRPTGNVTRIEGGYVFPICPSFIALPPEHRASVCLFSSSLVNGLPEISAPNTDSTFEAAARRFIDFSDIPHDGIGRTSHPPSAQARVQLEEARRERFRNATHEHKVERLPTLIATRELAHLRRNVPAPSRPCRQCDFVGLKDECKWLGWDVKCGPCAESTKDSCSFIESPEERMDASEAAYSWGHDSLTSLRRLLRDANRYRNLGNLNTAAAAASFRQFDQNIDEFVRRVFRLAGEDFMGSLTDHIFVEDHAIVLLNRMIDSLTGPDMAERHPDDLEPFYKALLESFSEYKTDDQIMLEHLDEERDQSEPESVDPDVDFGTQDTIGMNSSQFEETAQESDDRDYMYISSD